MRETAQSPDAFRHFLSWLDEGVDSGGEKYLEMRRRLVWYFDRKRCVSPDDLADETLTRVARRLDEEGDITDTPPARYCYIVAKFVFLEYLRQADRRTTTFTDFKAVSSSEPGIDDRERLLDCLDGCLNTMKAPDRDLILGYYRGEQRIRIEHRRKLAATFHLSANALSIRACRIREKLEACVAACSAGGEISGPDSSHQE
jgi:DNA-directed RNA polymerase specialized sigma24 family protein